MSSEGSENEAQAAVPKKIAKKTPKTQPDDQLQNKEEIKKLTTKDMINQALTELKSRKGTSLYAIKKYIEDKYKVDVEKLNYIIKKSIKNGVETGTIIQTKGVGASGSFRLAPGKAKAEKPTKKKQPKKKSVEKPTKPPKSNKPKEVLKETESTENKQTQKSKKKAEMSTSATSEGKKVKQKKSNAEPATDEPKMKKSKAEKLSKGSQTPAKKKAAMMKRKSIGSIIKPPKMKPKKG